MSTNRTQRATASGERSDGATTSWAGPNDDERAARNVRALRVTWSERAATVRAKRASGRTTASARNRFVGGIR